MYTVFDLNVTERPGFVDDALINGVAVDASFTLKGQTISNAKH